MPGMREQKRQLFFNMPAVLCALGQLRKPKQSARRSDVGLHSQNTGSAHEESCFGPRAPDPDETPLSPSEIEFGMERNLFNDEDSQ